MKTFLTRIVVVVLMLVMAFAVMRSQSGTSTQRFPQFENDDVKVWKTVLAPNKPIEMHRHDHPIVLVALSGGTVQIADQNGATQQHVWETGQAYWLPANLPNTMHADVDQSEKPIELIVVELKHER